MNHKYHDKKCHNKLMNSSAYERCCSDPKSTTFTIVIHTNTHYETILSEWHTTRLMRNKHCMARTVRTIMSVGISPRWRDLLTVTIFTSRFLGNCLVLGNHAGWSLISNTIFRWQLWRLMISSIWEMVVLNFCGTNSNGQSRDWTTNSDGRGLLIVTDVADSNWPTLIPTENQIYSSLSIKT